MEDYIGKICPFCKMEIREGDAVKVCEKCGTVHHASCWQDNGGCSMQHNDERPTGATNFCMRCGAELQEGQAFCHKCGQKVDAQNGADMNFAAWQSSVTNNEAKKKDKKLVIGIAIGVVVLAVIAVAIFVLPILSPGANYKKAQEYYGNKQYKEAVAIFEKLGDYENSAEMMNECNYELLKQYYENGEYNKVSEVAEKLGNYKDTKTMVKKARMLSTHNFNEMYSDLAKNSWCTIAADGSYLKIDSNPKDKESKYFNSDDWAIMLEAWEKVEEINKELGFSDAVNEKMNGTTALQGKQTESNNEYTVSWTYHPDNGLEVIYEFKK